MSKPRAPTPPDPTNTINAQTSSNVQTAQSGIDLNRINQYTPTGSITYGPNGQTTNLSPNQQALLSGQENIGMGLNNLANGNIARLGNLNFNSQQALGDYGKDIEARTYALATDRLGKQFDRSEEALRSRLANQGINAGTDAFNAEMAAFNEGKGNAYSDAQLAARGQAQSDRAQALGEMEGDYNRELGGLNNIFSLAGGYGPSGVSPSSYYTQGVSNTDVAGINQQGFNNQYQNYAQQMQSRNALLGGLFGLGGAALGNTSLFK